MRNSPIIWAKYLIAVYLIMSVLTSRWLLNDFIRTLISLPALILIPLFVGDITTTVICRSEKGRNLLYSLNLEILAFIFWIIGIFFIFVIFSISSFVFFSSTFVSFFVFILSLYAVSKSKLLECIKMEFVAETFLRRIMCACIVMPFIILSMFLPLLVLVNQQPFPLGLAETYGYIQRIVQLNSQNTIDLYGGHLPLPTPLFSLITKIYDVHPLYIFNTGHYLSHILYPIFAFFLCYGISRNIYSSTLACFISSWAYLGSQFTFENRTFIMLAAPFVFYMESLNQKRLRHNSILHTLLFPLLIIVIPLLARPSIGLLPRSLRVIAAFLPMLSILSTLNQSKLWKFAPSSIASIPLSIFAVSHESEAPIVILIWILFSISSRMTRLSGHRLIILLRAFIVAEILYILLVANNVLTFKFSDHFIFSRYVFGDLFRGTELDITPQSRYSILCMHGPELIVHLFMTCLLVLALLGKPHVLPITFAGSSSLFLSLLPEGHFIRFYDFIGPLMSVPISLVLLDAPSTLHLIDRIKIRIKDSKHLKIPKLDLNVKSLILLFFLVFMLFAPLQEPRLNYLRNISNKNPEGFASYLTTYETETAIWLSRNLKNQNIIIVSDPYTMFFFGNVLNTKTAMEKMIWIAEYEYPSDIILQMRNLKKQVFIDTEPQKIHESITNLFGRDETVVLIYSKRTSAWVSSNDMFIHFAPKEANMVYVEQLANSDMFTLYYHNGDDIYVYIVN